MTLHPFLTRLRDETRADHEAAEGALDLIRDDLTAASYQAQLAKLYGFYLPLEGRLGSHDWTPYGLDYAERRKVPLLEADLRALELDPARLPVCSDLPPGVRAAQAFGCFYVLEGATLGGRFIAPHIEKKLGHTRVSGARFFAGYGGETGKMWQAFTGSLAAFVAARGEEDEILEAARNTFSSLTRWVARPGVAGGQG